MKSAPGDILYSLTHKQILMTSGLVYADYVHIKQGLYYGNRVML